MRSALRKAALRGVRTTVQALAGVAASVPIVTSVSDAKVAGVVALWASVGAVIAGASSFLQNLAEGLEAEEQA
jgi:hypothetical protein